MTIWRYAKGGAGPAFYHLRGKQGSSSALYPPRQISPSQGADRPEQAAQSKGSFVPGVQKYKPSQPGQESIFVPH